MTDYAAGRFWLDVGQVAGLVALGVYSWWTNRARVTNDRFKEHNDRLIKLEQSVENAPTSKQYNELRGCMGTLSGELKKTEGKLDGINRVVDLINEFLIKQGGKG